jgi:hypothetical protein
MALLSPFVVIWCWRRGSRNAHGSRRRKPVAGRDDVVAWDENGKPAF